MPQPHPHAGPYLAALAVQATVADQNGGLRGGQQGQEAGRGAHELKGAGHCESMVGARGAKTRGEGETRASGTQRTSWSFTFGWSSMYPPKVAMA